MGVDQLLAESHVNESVMHVNQSVCEQNYTYKMKCYIQVS